MYIYRIGGVLFFNIIQYLCETTPKNDNKINTTHLFKAVC